MNKYKFSLIVLIIIAAALAYIVGCRGGGGTVYIGGDSNSSALKPALLKGTVLMPSVSHSLRLSSAEPPLEVAEAASVWLEKSPEISTKTNNEGIFTFVDISAGQHRIVAEKYHQGQLYINRSNIKVIQPGQIFEDPEPLTIYTANNIARGILLYEDGTPASAGTRLSLWGKQFTISSNDGTFDTPALPDFEAFDAIQYIIFEPSSPSSFEFPLSFLSSKEEEPTIHEITFSKTQTSSSPRATLLPLKEGKITTEVKVSEKLDIFALIEPPEAEIATWTASHGNLTNASQDGIYKKATWIAPQTGVRSAEILLRVKNLSNHQSVARIRIKVKGEFLVSFNSNGGTPIEPQLVRNNDYLKEPSEPQKEGAKFEGWFIDEALKTPWNFEQNKVVDETILYAKWKILNANSLLKTLLLSYNFAPLGLTPAFEPETSIYTISVAHNIEQIDITAIPSSGLSIMELNGLAFNNASSTKVLLNEAGTNTNLKISVTAEDLTQTNYAISVYREAIPSDKKIISISFPALQSPVSTSIDESSKTIYIVFPYGTQLYSLIPQIIHTGKTLEPDSEIRQNFSEPVYYKVTAIDNSFVIYSTHSSTAPNHANSIVYFAFENFEPSIEGTINEAKKTISLRVPYKTDVTNLTPKVVHSGTQISPASEIAQDFSTPIEYAVTAENGSISTYTVSVISDFNDQNDVISYGFDILDSFISGDIDIRNATINVAVPQGTDLTNLVATFTLSENATLKIANIEQVSGSTANDFSTEISCTVLAQNGQIKAYKIQVLTLDRPFISTDSIITNGQLNPSIILSMHNASFDPVAATIKENYEFIENTTSLTLDKIVRLSSKEVSLELAGKATSGDIDICVKSAAINTFLDSNSITLTVPSPVITTESIIMHGERDPKVTITLHNAVFNNDNSPNMPINYQITGDTALSIASAQKISDNQVLLGFSGITQPGNLIIMLKSQAMSAANDSNQLSITVTAPTITTETQIAHGQKNPILLLQLHNAHFNPNSTSTAIENYEVSGTSGLTIDYVILDAIDRIKLHLKGTATTGSLVIIAKSGAIDSITDTLPLSISIPERPSIHSNAIISYKEQDPVILLNLENAEFNVDNSSISVANYGIITDTGLVLDRVERHNKLQVTLHFKGVATSGTLQISVRGAAITSVSDSFPISLSVVALKVTSPTALIYKQPDPTITLFLQNATFNPEYSTYTDSYIVTNNGTNLTLVGATFESETQVTLKFSGQAEAGTLTISVKSVATSAFSDSDSMSFSVVPPTITSSSRVLYADSTPSVLIDLHDSNFEDDDSVSDLRNYIINPGTTALSLILAQKQNSSQILLTFEGPAEEGTIEIAVKSKAITAFADTNLLRLSVASPLISSTSSIAYGQQNPALIIDLHNASFVEDEIKIENCSITGETGLTLSSVSYISASQVRLRFVGRAEQGNLYLYIKGAALTSVSDTNTITFTVDAPTISTTSSIVHGQGDAIIILEITNAEFNYEQASKPENYEFDYDTTNILINKIVYENSSKVILHFVGAAQTGTLKIMAKAAAITSAHNTNRVMIDVPLGPFIKTNSAVWYGSPDTTIELELSYATFNSDGSATTIQNYVVNKGSTNLELTEVIKDSQNKVRLRFIGTAYPGTLEIIVKGAAISTVSDSNILKITVPNAPKVTSDSIIPFGETQPTVVLALENAKFRSKPDSEKLANYSISDSNNKLTIRSIYRVDDNHISVSLEGTAETGTVEILVSSKAITSYIDPGKVSFQIDSSPQIDTSATLFHGQAAPSIPITLTNAIFRPTAQSEEINNYSIISGGTSLLLSNVERISDNRVSLNFMGTTQPGTLQIAVRPAAITAAAQTNFVSIKVFEAVISTPSTISYGIANPQIYVDIENSTFDNDGAETITNYVATGLGLTLSKVEKINNTKVLLYFSGITQAGDLFITVKAGALTTSSDTNTLHLSSFAPLITSNSVILNGQQSPNLVIKLQHAKFNNDATSEDLTNYHIDTGSTNLTPSTITRNSDEQITISFNGSAQAGIIEVIAKPNATTSYGDTNNLTVLVGDTPSISTTSIIANSQPNPSIVLSLNNAFFNNDPSSEDLENYIIIAGTTQLSKKSVTRLNNTEVSLTFEGVANTGSLLVRVLGAALSTVSGTQQLEVIVPNPPTISTETTIGYAQPFPSVVVTLTNALFAENALAENISNYTIIDSANSLIPSSIIKNTDTQITIFFNGIASSGVLKITMKSDASNSFSDSQTLDIIIPDSPAISLLSTLLYGQRNPIIKLELTNAEFNEQASNLNNYSIDIGGTGLTLQSVNKKSQTQVELFFSGVTVAGNLKIQVKKDALTAFSDTNFVEILITAPRISTTSVIGYAQPNPIVAIELQNAIFNNDGSAEDIENYTIYAGTTELELSNATYNSDTRVMLEFSGNAKTGELGLYVNPEALNIFKETNTISVPIPLAPEIKANITEIPHGQVSPNLSIELFNATFNTDGSEYDINNYSLTDAQTGLKIKNIVSATSNQVTIALNGTANKTGSFELAVRASAITAFSETNSQLFTVPEAPTISTTSSVENGEIDPVIFLALTNATFNQDGSAEDYLNYQLDSHTTTLTLEPGYIQLLSSNELKITLKGTAAAGTIKLKVLGAAISAVSNTNNINITVDAPTISSVSTIAHGEENPKIVLELTNSEFKDAPQGTDSRNYSFVDNNTTLKIGSITKDSQTQVTITLTGVAHSGSVRIGVKSAAIETISDTNTILFNVPQAPTISSPSSIAYWQPNPSITINLANAQFRDGEPHTNRDNYYIGGNSGLTLANIKRDENNHSKITMSFTGNASTGNLEIQVLHNAITAYTDTNKISILIGEAPVITTTSYILHGDPAPSIMLSLSNATFNAKAIAEYIYNYHFEAGTTNLEIDTIERTNDQLVTINFTGPANEGTLKIGVKQEAISVFADTNKLDLSVPQAPHIITDSVIPHGQSDPTAIITLENATFKEVYATVIANYYFDADTTNLSIGLIQYLNENQIKIYFSGTAETGDIKLAVKGAAISAVSNTNELVLNINLAPVVTSPSIIVHGQESPTITLNIVNAHFNDEAENTDYYSVELGSTYLLFDHVSKVSDSQVILHFIGIARAGTIDVFVKGDALTSISPTNTIHISVPNPPTISSISKIVYFQSNPKVTVTLLNATFNNDMSEKDLANYHIDSGTTQLALAGISRISDTKIDLSFSGIANSGDLQIGVKPEAIDADSPSNIITITVPDSPQISTSDILLYGQINPYITISLANSSFVNNFLLYEQTSYLIDAGTTNLQFYEVVRDSSQQIKINFTGTAKGGDLKLTVKSLIIDAEANTNTITVTVPGAPTISSNSIIPHGQEDLALVVTIENATFNLDNSSTNINNYSFNFGTTELTIKEIERNAEDQITLTFDGTADTGTLTVRANASAITAYTNSNTISFPVPLAPHIETDSIILHGEKTASITVTLHNATFNPPPSSTNWQNYNFTDYGSGLSLTASSIERLSNTQIRVKLNGTAKTGYFKLSVKGDAMSAASTSDDLKVNVPDPPHISSPTSLFLHGAPDPSLIINLTNAVFNDDGSATIKANYEITGATTLAFSSAERINNKQVRLYLQGTAQTGSLNVKILANAINAYTNTTVLSVTVDSPPTISSNKKIVYGESNPSIALVLSKALFNADGTAANINNYQIIGHEATELTLTSATVINDTTVSLYFIGQANTGTLQIAVKGDAITTYSGTAPISFIVPSAPRLTADATIPHGRINPVINVYLANAEFNNDSSTTTPENYTFAFTTTTLNNPYITRVSSTQLRILLEGTADGGTVSIRASAAPITAAAPTNQVDITVPDAPFITTASAIGHGKKNPSITIALENATFNDDGSELDLENYIIEEDTSGLELNEVERESDTTVILTFKGTSKEGDLEISIKGLAITADSDTNTIAISIGMPTISSPTTISNGQINPELIISIENAEFIDDNEELNNPANYIQYIGSTELEFGNAQWLNANQIKIQMQGRAQSGIYGLIIKGVLTTAVTNTNRLNFEVPALPIISTEAKLINGELNPLIDIKLTNAKFNSDETGYNPLNYYVEGSGLTLASVTVVNDNEATLELSGIAAAGTLYIRVLAAAITSDSDTNTLGIIVSLPPYISTTSMITHGQENPTVDLTLEHAEFLENKANNISYYNIVDESTGLILLRAIWQAKNQVTLEFLGTAEPGTLHVQVLSEAITSHKNTNILDFVVTLLHYVSPNIGYLRYVPEGSFFREGNPANISTTSVFRISENLITQKQFEEITQISNPSYYSGPFNDDFPVETVSWYHALVFCNKLSILESLTPTYSINGSTDPDDWGEVPTSNNASWNAVTCDWEADGYRLTTETEWVWAAMGSLNDKTPGAVSDELNLTGYNKPFSGSDGSNNILNFAWYVQNNDPVGTKKVGTKTFNELKVYDMSGNIWEWCWDWNATFPDGELIDYRGSETGTVRVLHGGSFSNAKEAMAINYRTAITPSSSDRYYGFRVMRK